jgi:hypothetical protein
MRYELFFSYFGRSEVGGGGMPSNHSQFVCFFATFYIMCFFFKCPALDRLFRVIYSLGLVMLACAVTFSRCARSTC